MLTPSARTLLEQNLILPSPGLIDARTILHHFSIVSYKVPVVLLEKHIPKDFFEIETVQVDNMPYGMISAVSFLDIDFSFYRLFPWLKFNFGQTNHRAYVINKKSGKRGVWFFGTTLGSPWVVIPRALWKIPWYRSQYQIDCSYNSQLKQYDRYSFNVASDWCKTEISITDSGVELPALPGFTSIDDSKLVLTHPIDGYYRRLDGQIGSYSVWHPEMKMTLGKSNHLYFSLYERLGILSKTEMMQPHSILITPEVEFKVFLPPKKLS